MAIFLMIFSVMALLGWMVYGIRILPEKVYLTAGAVGNASALIMVLGLSIYIS